MKPKTDIFLRGAKLGSIRSLVTRHRVAVMLSNPVYIEPPRFACTKEGNGVRIWRLT